MKFHRTPKCPPIIIPLKAVASKQSNFSESHRRRNERNLTLRLQNFGTTLFFVTEPKKTDDLLLDSDVGDTTTVLLDRAWKIIRKSWEEQGFTEKDIASWTTKERYRQMRLALGTEGKIL